MEPFFQEIKEDHNELKELMKNLNSTTNSPKQKEKLFSELMMEIKPHMKAEEKVLYPALIEQKESREDALESMEEHHVTEILLNELDKLSKSEDQWRAKMKVFSELVEHHIEEEEGEIFKDAREVLSDEKISTIYDQWKKEKEQVKSQM